MLQSTKGPFKMLGTVVQYDRKERTGRVFCKETDCTFRLLPNPNAHFRTELRIGDVVEFSLKARGGVEHAILKRLTVTSGAASTAKWMSEEAKPKPAKLKPPPQAASKDQCGHCGKWMVPRLVTDQGHAIRSLCPFCGELHKDFPPEAPRTPFWIRVVGTLLGGSPFGR